ncbi:hypothetical protein DB346_02360 [Verrucomicrobia bacterium LW23]|nr:hypothetical protein DB346_02360 [Verrucomicrobia bacterium LW23]
MLYSQDGLPFAKTKRASLSLVSTSFNSGFRLDPAKLAASNNGLQPGAVVAGKAPVLVTRAGAILTAPALAGMTYTLRDWNMKSLGSGTIPPNGVLKLEAADPIWVLELTREPQSGDAR